MTRRGLSRLILSIAVLASSEHASAEEPPGPASAAPSDDDVESRARALFEQGRTLLAGGRAAEACEAFALSDALAPAIGTLLNLGLCHRTQGKSVRAIAFFRAAEQLALAKEDGERRALAERDADELAARVGTLRIHIADRTEGDLTILLDGVEQPRSAMGSSVLVDPGHHDVEARSGRRAPFRTAFDARPGEHVEVDVPPPPAPVSTKRAASSGVKGDGGTRVRAIAAIGSGVIGLAGVGAAIGFSVAARSAFDDSSPHCTSHDVCDPTGVALRHDAAARATRADVAAVVGGVGIAASVGLGLSLMLGGDAKDTGRTAITVGTRGAFVAGQFR